MMRRSCVHDATASPGYNERLLTGERLARMKACAEKASTTFPPAFVNEPQPEDEATTPEGDDALARGRWANERRKPAPRDSGSLAAASRPAAPARSRRRAPQARARSPRASRRPRSSTASSAGPTGATRPRRRGKKNAPAKPPPGTSRSAGSTTATSSRTRACACSSTRATRTRRPAPWRGAASQATTSPIATRNRRSSTRAKTTLVDNGTRAK